MTRDEIMSMEAGREIDALIAEKVMGWKRRPVWHGSDMKMCLIHPSDGTYYPDEFPNYSEDISAAWAVVKSLDNQNFDICILNTVGGWKCEISGYIARNCPAPLAICRAALLVAMEEKSLLDIAPEKSDNKTA